MAYFPNGTVQPGKLPCTEGAMKQIIVDGKDIGKIWRDQHGDYGCIVRDDGWSVEGKGHSADEAVESAIRQGWLKAREIQTAMDNIAKKDWDYK